MRTDDDDQAPSTERDGPGAKRRASIVPRQAWAFERDPFGLAHAVTAVKVICGGCSREIRLAPPRFTVEESGEVRGRDEGAAFRCTQCDQPIGPLILADWRFGKLA